MELVSLLEVLDPLPPNTPVGGITTAVVVMLIGIVAGRGEFDSTNVVERSPLRMGELELLLLLLLL